MGHYFLYSSMFRTIQLIKFEGQRETTSVMTHLFYSVFRYHGPLYFFKKGSIRAIYWFLASKMVFFLTLPTPPLSGRVTQKKIAASLRPCWQDYEGTMPDGWGGWCVSRLRAAQLVAPRQPKRQNHSLQGISYNKRRHKKFLRYLKINSLSKLF